MAIAKVTIRGVTPYSPGKYYDVPRKKNEDDAGYEKRTWRNRCHVTKGGFVFVPPNAFKNCLSECAKYRSEQIVGKGKATYTKHFEAGVMVIEPLVLALKVEDVESETLFVPSNGQRGGAKRVKKIFPLIEEWGGVVTFHILDDTITQEVFERHVRASGVLIGVGRFRPRRNGWYGRFEVIAIEWVAE